MKRGLLLAIVALGVCNSLRAQNCTEREAFAAETVTDYLDSWQNVHLFFKQFRRCYDASIAEGAADKIQQLWSYHWSDLPNMLKLTKQDPDFRSFILQRIKDEDFPQDRFRMVVQHARQSCPLEGREFCRELLLEAVKLKQ